jgi:hypothetical protein
MSFDPYLDRREAILERLLQIGQALPGIASAHRNHGPSETGELGVPRPAFLLFDGSAKLAQDPKIFKSPLMPVLSFYMTPQIVIALEDRNTIENRRIQSADTPIGPEISQWLMLIHSMVANDAVIVDLLTPNGMHLLRGFETDLQVGRTVGAYGAWLMMLYEFNYPMFPSR